MGESQRDFTPEVAAQRLRPEGLLGYSLSRFSRLSASEKGRAYYNDKAQNDYTGVSSNSKSRQHDPDKTPRLQLPYLHLHFSLNHERPTLRNRLTYHPRL